MSAPVHTRPAVLNVLAASPTGEPLFARLAMAVTNDGSTDAAALWLYELAAKAIDEPAAMPTDPFRIYDLFIDDIEAMCAVWRGFEASARDAAWPVPVGDALPSLARFLCERLPAVWRGGLLGMVDAPATRALVLADRIDTLVGLFRAGLKPNGSKDPLALRRAAKEVVQMTVFPITPGACRSAMGRIAA